MPRFSLTLRTTLGQAFIDLLGPSARVQLYTAAYGVLLIEFTCDATAFAPAPVGGVITANPVTDGIAVATGTAVVGQLVLLDGSTVVVDELTVSDSLGSGDLKLAQTGTLITSGVVYSLASIVIPVGNAT